MTAEPVKIEVPAVWVGVDDLPIQLASQFLSQISGPGRGHHHGRPGGSSDYPRHTPEEQAAQASAISFVQVRAMVRLSMTPHRVRELVEVLNKTLEQHEQIFGKKEEG